MKSATWAPRRMALAGTLALAALGPAACGGEAEQAPAGPQAPKGIEVSKGRLALPPVSGNPAAVYFDIANAGPGAATIRGAQVEGAQSAMLHVMAEWNLQADMQEVTQVPLPAGETVKFEPGAMHVMVMGLADTVKAGSAAQVTLNFAGGDKLTFPAQVQAAGDVR